MTKLNRDAQPFYPPTNRYLSRIYMEPYHEGYVVKSPPQVTQPFTFPLSPSYYHQPYFHGVEREDVPHLQPETTFNRPEDAFKRDSKRRFVRAMINGCGRKAIARHTKGFRPPRLDRRPNGTGAGCSRQTHEGTLGDFKVSSRDNRKNTKHPLQLDERNTTIMIRNIPNRYTFVSEPK